MQSIIKTIRDFWSPAPPPTAPAPIKQTLEEIHGTTSEERRILYYLRESARVPPKATKSRVITFELIPGPQSNRNVRSYLEFVTGDFKAWQNISRECEKLAGAKCAICKRSSVEPLQGGKDYATECHEVWSYDTARKIQKLEALQSLCAKCHQIKHINQYDKSYLNESSSKYEKEDLIFNDLLGRYRRLNRILPGDAKAEYKAAKLQREERNSIKFSLDLSLISEAKLFDCHSENFGKFLLQWKKDGSK